MNGIIMGVFVFCVLAIMTDLFGKMLALVLDTLLVASYSGTVRLRRVIVVEEITMPIDIYKRYLEEVR